MPRRGNNEGSIVPRPGGKIQARVTVGVKDDGSIDRISKTFLATEKTLAREWIADQISAMGRGMNLSARNTTWSELQKLWLATKKATVSNSSYVRSDYMSRHVPWKDEPVKECVNLIQPFINEISAKFAPKTIREIYAVIHGVMELAVEKGIIHREPKIRLPRIEERVPTVMSIEQISFLIQASKRHKSKYAFGLWLELGTGLRRGEMLALNWSDVDWDGKTITVNKSLVREGDGYELKHRTKTKAGMRTIDVPEMILAELKQSEGTGKMFKTDSGEYLLPWNWSRLFRSWREQADKLIATHNEKNKTSIGSVGDVRFHDLRHQFASFLHSLGVSPRTAQQMTGHADMPTLMQRYTHVTPELTREAADKLNEALKPLLN